ncbi:MAG: T9SS type A sorting domain-containing protein [Bacteroidia bacterium]|nr:T9SS type A sorting domain-containing protein [Bacteroidia bacterium]
MKRNLLLIISSLMNLVLQAQITEICPAAIDAFNMHVVNGKMLYGNRPLTGSWVFELWATDGTFAGTHLVKDINPNSADELFNYYSSTGVQKYSNCVFNGELYFFADDGIHGMELWKSDATEVGTNLVLDITPGYLGWDFSENKTPGFCVSNGVLYFKAGNSVNGYELWKTDGTPTGTVEVKDIYPGAIGSNPHFITSFNGKIYFIAKDAMNGWELFCSDGTAGGTFMLKDIVPGPAGAFNDGTDVSIDPQFKVCGNYLYFVTDNNGFTPVEGHLWRTDGTTAGTIQLETTLEPKIPFGPLNKNVVTGCLYNEFFFQATGGVSNSNLWKTDGTVAGTVEVMINSAFDVNSSLMSIGDYIYLAGKDSIWAGLARTDGTPNSTNLFFKYTSSNGPFDINYPSFHNGNMFFHIFDGEYRLVQSNGTNQGTIVYPGVRPFTHLVPVGNELFFLGQDSGAAVTSSKLYKLTPAPLGPAVGEGLFETKLHQSLPVYPNPASSILHIKNEGNEMDGAELSLIDITGRNIFTKRLDINIGSTTSIPIPENVSDGMYVVRLKNSKGYNTTSRMLIMR